MRYYLYNTTDKTHFSKPVYKLSGFLGVTDICLDEAFIKSLQAVELTYYPNENGGMLYLSNTNGKAGTLKIDDNLRSDICGVHVKAKHLEATEKNPIVMAITKNIKISGEANAYFRVLFLGDYLLVILISGIIYIEDENGDWFPMRRSVVSYNTTGGLVDENITESIKNLVVHKDIKTGRVFNEFCILDVVMGLRREYLNSGDNGNGVLSGQYIYTSISGANSIPFNPERLNRYYLREQLTKRKTKKKAGVTMVDVNDLIEANEEYTENDYYSQEDSQDDDKYDGCILDDDDDDD